MPAFLLLLAFGTVHAATQPGVLQIRDDRGQAITTEMEVCFQIATRSECIGKKGEAVEVPPDFLSVRVEGPDHGPAFARRGDLKKEPDGGLLLVVPRKALLTVAGSSEERLAVSLYPQDDPAFRVPSFKGEVRGGASLKVPAGDHLVSLTASGKAPDLHLLSAKPGRVERLTYRSRPGWSLVLRCQDDKEEAPVEAAQVELSAMEGFSAGGRPERQVSGKSGLVLFSGVPHLLASARVSHPRFVLHGEEGISASPGTFTFREALLQEGGRLRVAVTSEGKPQPELDCRVLEYDPNPQGPAPEPKVHFQGTTDKEGICRSGRLSAGPYTLRLARPGHRTFLDRSVVVSNGEETALEVPLISIRIHGTVLRGSQPVPSYAVTFSDLNEGKTNATRRDAQAEGTTNEEGEYETLLWSPGDYYVLLRTPKGTPAGSRRLRLENAEEQADFFLREYDISGVVLDERDKPVAGTAVRLSWNSTNHRLATTDEKGFFSFPLTEDGQGSIEFLKQGYQVPLPVDVEARPDAPPPPLVLRLKRKDLFAGKLLAAAGPAAGASLLSYRIEPGGLTTPVGITTADSEGRFELATAGGAPTRVFATGAGCPLTSFDLVPAAEEVVLHCAELPASLELRFTDEQGSPVPGKSVFARKDGIILPQEVLTLHLGRLHLSPATDGGGRLFLAGLAPGNYDIYLAEATWPELVAGGAPTGLLTASSLAPLTTTELEITIEAEP